MEFFNYKPDADFCQIQTSHDEYDMPGEYYYYFFCQIKPHHIVHAFLVLCLD